VSVRGVLFDVDGTLVDSNVAHANAWHDTFAEAGLDGGDVERIRRLIGMGSDKLLPTAVGIDKNSPQGERLAKRRSEIFKQRYLPQVRGFPCARELMDALAGCSLTLGVATSAQPDELRELLRIVDAEWLAERAASSDGVKSSKPDPDVVEAALERIGLPAAEVVLVGDTPYDVEASLRARIRVVALRCGGWNDEELRGAAAVYQDPADLLAHLEESPLA
jgi:phosphoglycolate phosphatase-like HAD superfamily hydrolase